MIRSLIYLTFSCCLLAAQISNAQTSSTFVIEQENRFDKLHGQFDFRDYSVDEGLPQSQVNYVYEDSRGFIWLATQGGGVCRFDGIKFVQYEEKDGLAGQIVKCIEEDDQGNMWFGSTWGGMSLFNGKKFKIYDHKSGLIDNAVNTILFDTLNKHLLIGTARGLNTFDYSKFKNVKFDDSQEGVEITDLKHSQNGILVGTSKGLFLYKNNATSLIEGTKDLFIRSVTVDDIHQVIWLVHTEGILCFSKQGANFQLIDPFSSLKNFSTTSVTCVGVSNQDIWFGTKSDGVYLLRENRLSHYGVDEGFPHSQVEHIHSDKSGRVWFGTNGAGVVVFKGFAFTYYFGIEGLNTQDIFGITKDKEGNVWVATATQGVFSYNGVSVKHFGTKEGLYSMTSRAIICDKSGAIWVGTKEGLNKIVNGRVSGYKIKDGLPENSIRCLYQINSGEIYIGTAGGGLSIFDGKSFSNYDSESGLSHNYVHSILQDSKGVVWIGTGDGLYKFYDKKFMRYSVDEGLCNSYVGNIVEDNFGNIWVGTDKCISRFNGHRFTNYTVNEGLTSGTIYLMALDKEGNLISGTNKGFDKIKFSAYGQISSINNYSKSEGFRGIECNTKAVYVDDEGAVWFGTVKGLIRYDLSEEIKTIPPPTILLSSVKVFYDDKWMKNTSSDNLNWYGVPDFYRFRHDQNTISFLFEGICTNYPERIKYSFYLDGFNEDWSPLVSEPTASYSNLAPGDYVFWVRAKGDTGLWSDPVSFSFTIYPAFWQTWWFGLGMVILIVYSIYYVNSLLQRNIMRQNHLLEEKVMLRTQEILKQKEEKDLLLKEIHHRVKNNMQVIVSLLNIHSDYVQDAASQALIEDSKSRIRSMALIHEKLYESRNFSKINIGDYLDTLVDDLISTYGISTKIKVDKEIETVSFGFDTLIPLGLLLNELVTNSLKYAFKDREEGTIYFHLKENGKVYDLLVGDNGIGMDRERFNTMGKTIGVDLVRILVEQLNGEIELLEGPGTKFRIRFESIDKRRI